MFIVGLTGGIASGKSTVSKMMIDRGCVVIDADQISRDVVKVDEPAHKKIVAAFGESILLPTGELNRAALGDIIFNDASKRRILNQCTHPYIHRRMLFTILSNFFQGKQFVVMDLPLLYEAGAFLKFFSSVIVVKCTYQQEVERLMLRNSLTLEQAVSRINAQMPLEEKCRQADIIIDNTGSVEETRQQVDAVVEIFQSSWRHVMMRLLLLLVLSPLAVGLSYLFL